MFGLAAERWRRGCIRDAIFGDEMNGGLRGGTFEDFGGCVVLLIASYFLMKSSEELVGCLMWLLAECINFVVLRLSASFPFNAFLSRRLFVRP